MNICSFLNNSYTAYHAVKNSENFLLENGFSRLELQDKWAVKIGRKYYVVKNGSALIAFTVGENFAFNIAASHTDSPCLHIKGKELIPSLEGARLNVEVYGGLILYSLLDTPLKIAGRIVVKEDNKLVSKLVESDYNVVIPSLAIHHNPTVNNGMAISVQKDMLPLLGDVEDFYKTLTDDKVVDADLYVVPAQTPFRSGVNNEYLSSPRIDNLTSVYTSLQALATSTPQNIAIVACFDNEEIGNRTKQGAASSLLQNVLDKITLALGKDHEDFISACENGFLLSIDNAHALHPSFPEKMDIKERVYMNKGIVIKHHVNYSTDGLSSAILKTLLDKNNVEWQDYYNNSDQRCGSTLGLAISTDLSMKACDIGLAQLAMHSGIETVGTNDIDKMQACVQAFLNSNICDKLDSVNIE